MFTLTILQTTFWFLVTFPFLVARNTILPPDHILLNIPPIKFLLSLTFETLASFFHHLGLITRESLKQVLWLVNTCLILMTLAASIYPGALAPARYIPALLKVERNMIASWFTVFLTMHYIGLSPEGEVWRVMRYLRRGHYGALIDCAVACCGVLWVAGALAGWAEFVLYVALAIVDIYQLDWVGDRDGRLEHRERFEVWEWCGRVIQDWRGWVEARAASGGDLEGTSPDTVIEQVPARDPRSEEDPGSPSAPESIATEAAGDPLSTSNS